MGGICRRRPRPFALRPHGHQGDEPSRHAGGPVPHGGHDGPRRPQHVPRPRRLLPLGSHGGVQLDAQRARRHPAHGGRERRRRHGELLLATSNVQRLGDDERRDRPHKPHTQSGGNRPRGDRRGIRRDQRDAGGLGGRVEVSAFAGGAFGRPVVEREGCDEVGGVERGEGVGPSGGSARQMAAGCCFACGRSAAACEFAGR